MEKSFWIDWEKQHFDDEICIFFPQNLVLSFECILNSNIKLLKHPRHKKNGTGAGSIESSESYKYKQVNLRKGFPGTK